MHGEPHAPCAGKEVFDEKVPLGATSHNETFETFAHGFLFISIWSGQPACGHWGSSSLARRTRV